MSRERRIPKASALGLSLLSGCLPGDGLEFLSTNGAQQTVLILREACGRAQDPNACEQEWRLLRFGQGIQRAIDSEDAHVMFFVAYSGTPEDNCIFDRGLDDWQQTESDRHKGWELPTPVAAGEWKQGGGDARSVPWTQVWRYLFSGFADRSLDGSRTAG